MQKKGSYNSRERYDNDPAIKEVMDALASDRFCPNEPGMFRWIFDELVSRNDRYFHIADFPGYVETHNLIDGEYQQDSIWWRKATLNVARIGKFSSDRTVLEYARDIWWIGPYDKGSYTPKIPQRSPIPASTSAPKAPKVDAGRVTDLQPAKPVPVAAEVAEENPERQVAD
jgi:starch phosphorylase